MSPTAKNNDNTAKRGGGGESNRFVGKGLFPRFACLKNKNRGASLVEVVLLVALLIIASIWALGSLGKSVQNRMEILAGEMDPAKKRRNRIEQLIRELEQISDFSTYSGVEQLLQALGMTPLTSYSDMTYKFVSSRIAAYEDLYAAEIGYPFKEGELTRDEHKKFTELLLNSMGNLPNAGETYETCKQLVFDVYNSTSKSTEQKFTELRHLEGLLYDESEPEPESENDSMFMQLVQNGTEEENDTLGIVIHALAVILYSM